MHYLFFVHQYDDFVHEYKNFIFLHKIYWIIILLMQSPEHKVFIII